MPCHKRLASNPGEHPADLARFSFNKGGEEKRPKAEPSRRLLSCARG